MAVNFLFENNGRKFWLTVDKESLDFAENLEKVWQASKDELKNSQLAEAYLRTRGISKETAIKAGVGFCSKIQKVGSNFTNCALIFPKFQFKNDIPAFLSETTDKANLMELTGIKRRNFDPNTLQTPKNLDGTEASKNLALGKQGLAGMRFLDAAEPCFIVEGDFDYLTFLQAGFNALCLGGTNGKGQLLDYLKHKQIAAPLILALDNDEAGFKAEKELRDKLKHTDFEGVDVLKFSFFHDKTGAFNSFAKQYKFKDANDFLQFDQKQVNFSTVGIEAFDARCKELIKEAKDDGNFDDKLDPAEAAIKNERQWEILSLNDFEEEFQKRRAELQNAPTFYTPFKELNSILGGGMRPKELYVFGALSGAGKTDFALQLAEHVARQGSNVLYLNFEVPTEQCVARILSRRSYFADPSQGKSVSHFLTVKDGQTEDLRFGLEKEVGDKMFFKEGGFLQDTVEQLDNILERFIGRDEKSTPPLVILDYLQLMKTDKFVEKMGSDKQILDDVMKHLKRIANKHAVPILILSSFSRAAYSGEPTMAAFKESGLIEYTAENLWVFDVAEEVDDIENPPMFPKKKEERRKELKAAFDLKTAEGGSGLLALKVLKNRNGKSGGSLRLFYNKVRHTFYDNDPEAAIFKTDGTISKDDGVADGVKNVVYSTDDGIAVFQKAKRSFGKSYTPLTSF